MGIMKIRKPGLTNTPVRVYSRSHNASASNTLSRAYTNAEIGRSKLEADAQQREKEAAMTKYEANRLEELRAGLSNPAENTFGGDILRGDDDFTPSHGGGEWMDILDDEKGESEEVRQDFLKKKKRKYEDYRTRRDRTDLRSSLFEQQMAQIKQGYLDCSLEAQDKGFGAAPCSGESSFLLGNYTIRVVDVFSTYHANATMLHEDEYVASALVRQGCIPCSPIKPTVVVSTRLLEIFRVTHLHCPRLAIEPFVKAICEIHGIPFRKYLATQFSISFDLYLAIQRSVREDVLSALNRESPLSRCVNSCPACFYKVKDEKKLTFDFLFCQDGNNSLKRLITREPSPPDPGTGDPALGSSRERLDTRTCASEYFISREEVNRFANVPPPPNPSDNSPCLGRWSNMAEDITSKMWGVFDETGLFASICRHGFIMYAVDMVKSGELSKYALATVNRLLEEVGKDMGGGYDIGCQFAATLKHSPIGPVANYLGFRSLVGSFHVHAHGRECQLSYLGTYVKGMGLEDLEGCERLFYRTNELSRSTRYSSVFHRHQEIVTYLRHLDRFETYYSLTDFILGNYRQALSILESRPTLLTTMSGLGVKSESEFSNWLAEELKYLQGLESEPAEETLAMEYYSKLIVLEECSREVNSNSDTFSNATPTTLSQGIPESSLRAETARRHLNEKHAIILRQVQDLERKMEITERWTVLSKEWKPTQELVRMRTYRRAIDHLESLVVRRLFEMTKMNVAGTCYKLRTHMSKALQSRSKAIRTALEVYNKAASTLTPPRRLLHWEEVSEYSFLSDFDLLRDSRIGIKLPTWATPAGRYAMDTYFKTQRAAEELDRLNIEIVRVATHLRDEDTFLLSRASLVAISNPQLSHQILLYRAERSQFADHHHRRLKEISKLPGFTGSILPGIELSSPSVPVRPVSLPVVALGSVTKAFVLPTPSEEELEMEEAAVIEEEDEEIDVMLQGFMGCLQL